MRYVSVIAAAATVVVAGCSAHVQESSGSAYLERYKAQLASTGQPAPTAQPASASASVEAPAAAPDFEEFVRRAAAVEPILEFPAKIGLARIQDGGLSVIPAAESTAWREAAFENKGIGTFQPVSPAIVAFTAQTVGANYAPATRWARSDVGDVMAAIRLGAARQHMDAVLIYEVGSYARKEDRWNAITRLSVLGSAIVPTREIGAFGVGHAMLIDVRNGYVYGFATAETDLTEDIPFWGSSSDWDNLKAKAYAKALSDLMPEIRTMLGKIAASAVARKRLRESADAHAAQSGSAPRS